MAKGYKGSKGKYNHMEHNTKTALGFGIPLAGVLAIIGVVSLANGTMFMTQVKPAPTAVVPQTTQGNYGDLRCFTHREPQGFGGPTVFVEIPMNMCESRSNVQNSYIATADLTWLKQNLSSGDSIQLLNGDTYP